MLRAHDEAVVMHKGDYGLPLPITVDECCRKCGELLQKGDVLRFILTKRGEEILRQDEEVDLLPEDDKGHSVMVIALTQKQAEQLTVGYYRWSLILYRDGEYQNTLISRAPWRVTV